MPAFETIRERSKNLLIYSGITAMTGAAMLGVGGSVFAQDESTPAEETTESTTVTDRQTARAAEYAAFLGALAVNLGVADGEISADLATELKLAVDSGEYPVGLHLPGMGGFGGPGMGGDHDGRGGPKGDHDGCGRGRGGDDDVDVDDTLTLDTGTATAGSAVAA